MNASLIGARLRKPRQHGKMPDTLDNMLGGCSPIVEVVIVAMMALPAEGSTKFKEVVCQAPAAAVSTCKLPKNRPSLRLTAAASCASCLENNRSGPDCLF